MDEKEKKQPLAKLFPHPQKAIDDMLSVEHVIFVEVTPRCLSSEQQIDRYARHLANPLPPIAVDYLA